MYELYFYTVFAFSLLFARRRLGLDHGRLGRP